MAISYILSKLYTVNATDATEPTRCAIIGYDNLKMLTHKVDFGPEAKFIGHSKDITINIDELDKALITFDRNKKMQTNLTSIFGVTGLNLIYVLKRITSSKKVFIDLTAGYYMDAARTALKANISERVVAVTRKHVTDVPTDNTREEAYNEETYHKNVGILKKLFPKLETIYVEEDGFDLKEPHRGEGYRITNILDDNTLFWVEARDYKGDVNRNTYANEQSSILMGTDTIVTYNSTLVFITDCNINKLFYRTLEKITKRYEKTTVTQSPFTPSGRLMYIFINKLRPNNYHTKTELGSVIINSIEEYGDKIVFDDRFFSKSNLAMVEAILRNKKDKIEKLVQTTKQSDYKNTKTNLYSTNEEVLNKIPLAKKLYNEIIEGRNTIKEPLDYYPRKRLYGHTIDNSKLIGLSPYISSVDADQKWTRCGAMYDILGIEPGSDEDLISFYQAPMTSSRGTFLGVCKRFDTDSTQKTKDVDFELYKSYIENAEKIGKFIREMGKRDLGLCSIEDLITENEDHGIGINTQSSVGKFDKQYGNSIRNCLENPIFIEHLKKVDNILTGKDKSQEVFELPMFYNIMAKRREILPNKANKVLDGILTPRNIIYKDITYRILYKRLFKKRYTVFNSVESQEKNKNK